ncbi:MAG: hypothetical protein HZB53_20065 [Chloroflexi bacterium]|nr:hypothetical protein [Chloroflexota bacterium]
MAIVRTFRIESTPKDFQDWILNTSSLSWPGRTSFKTESGEIKLGGMRAESDRHWSVIGGHVTGGQVEMYGPYIVVDVIPMNSRVIEVTAHLMYDRPDSLVQFFNRWLSEISREYADASKITGQQPSDATGGPPATPSDAKRGPGRTKLDHTELIYRLAKAQEGEELRARDGRYWKEIAEQIAWKHGKDKAGVKLLEDARLRLKRHKADKGIMREVKAHREKEKKKIP